MQIAVTQITYSLTNLEERLCETQIPIAIGWNKSISLHNGHTQMQCLYLEESPWHLQHPLA